MHRPYDADDNPSARAGGTPGNTSARGSHLNDAHCRARFGITNRSCNPAVLPLQVFQIASTFLGITLSGHLTWSSLFLCYDATG